MLPPSLQDLPAQIGGWWMLLICASLRQNETVPRGTDDARHARLPRQAHERTYPAFFAAATVGARACDGALPLNRAIFGICSTLICATS